MTQPLGKTQKAIDEFVPEYRPPVPTQEELETGKFSDKKQEGGSVEKVDKKD